MFFGKTRLRIAKRLLQKKNAKVKRQKRLFDFATAGYIGVICSTDNADSVKCLKEFLSHLTNKGIKYLVLGYFNGKQIPENYLYWKDMDFITQKNLSFLYVPQGETVEKFIAEPFDILINCSMEERFPIEYIVSMSKATFKVGIMHQDYSSYDLMVDTSKKNTVEYFLENLELYLSDLRHPSN